MKLAVFTLLPLTCFPYTAGSKLPATGSLTDNVRNLIQCISMTVSSGNDPEVFCTPQISPKTRMENPLIRRKRKNGSCRSPCQVVPMMMSMSRLENKMAKILQQNSRSIQIVGPSQLIKGDKINLGACRGGCTSAHSVATKKMNFGNHYEGFCYPSNTVSLQVKFGSKVLEIPGVITTECQCGFGHHCNL